MIQTMTDVFGVPAPTATFSDIDGADVILIVDSNIICTHPVIALEALRAHRSGSSRVLVMGHRSNKLTTQCMQFARTVPGSEVALLNCLANLLIEKGGLDEAALESSSDGYDNLKPHLTKYSLRDAAARTGTDAAIISEIAEAIGEAKNFLLVLSPGSLHSAVNSSIARAAVNLAVLKNGKVLSLLREGNAQGAQDMGVSQDFLPGYQEAAAAKNGPLALYDILHGVESGEVKALYLMGGDIRKEMALLGVPLETLQALECLVVQDVFGGPVAEMAHVLLPACSSAESEASYTNACRVVQHSARAIEPIGQCRSDLEILSGLARELGLPLPDSIREVRKRIASTVPIYGSLAGIPQQLNTDGWDYSKVASNVRRKFSLATESRVKSDEAYPYIVTCDTMPHFGGAASLHSPAMAKVRVDGVVEVGEDDAKALGAENGTRVEIRIKGGGSAVTPVRISRELPQGVIGIPAHDLALVQKLISKLELSTFRAEASTPVWLASVNVAKD